MIKGSRRVSSAMQGAGTVAPQTFRASVDPDIVASRSVQVLPGGADEERALRESAEIIGKVSSCSHFSSGRPQGIRQYNIEPHAHAAPSPVKPVDLIGAAATEYEGDTFEGTAVHSPDESTLQPEQTPCNVAETVLDKVYFSDNWDAELNAIAWLPRFDDVACVDRVGRDLGLVRNAHGEYELQNAPFPTDFPLVVIGRQKRKGCGTDDVDRMDLQVRVRISKLNGDVVMDEIQEGDARVEDLKQRI